MSDESTYRIADRFALQQTWWIASELARRHPELQITRLEDLESIPIIVVHDGPTGKRVQFDLVGGIQYFKGAIHNHITWPEVFSQNDAHAVMRGIEDGVGFGVTETTPATTPRSLVYRVVARLLAMNVDDRKTWQVVSAPIMGVDGATDATYTALESFSTAIDAAETYVTDAISQAAGAGTDSNRLFWHEPLWLLLEDFEPVAVLDEGGIAHLPNGAKIDLLRMYRSFGRDLNPVATLLIVDPDIALRIAIAAG
jgi:hypothetical protein